MNCQRVFSGSYTAEMFGSVLLIMSHNIFPDESEIHLLKEKYHPTGVVFWKSSEDSLRLGVDRCLHQPIELDEIARVVDAATNRRSGEVGKIVGRL